ncbi:beta-glucosidase 17-like isoform X2 [Diospyros lotus]|uniref:beta-glucosidase 17-like isoform X2 n=1 Tax=Diospyros lotus TaxID=55363 RepID=UPI0022532291|nr:beta-glucosidase 17-like isoform X2 [Diospyros lotus]
MNQEDIAQMKAIGFDAFRFSISWSRIFPKGKLSGGVNPLGVQFYNDLIDNILLNGLKPYVTLFHWDLPQALDNEYGGFLSHMIMNDYLDYVDFCFKTYGDRVKYWFTVNEPYEFSALGYAKGIYAPGRCSNYVGNCTLGNSATEPYIVGHHLVLSHAAAVRLYREKYKASQKGQIGVTLSSKWYEPFSNDNVSQKAALRAVDFVLGWFLHPITYGNYPQSMQSLVGNRLPKFTKKETQMLKESFDFLGINYYSSYYAADVRVINTSALSMTTDNHIIEYMTKNGVPIGKPTDLDWLYIYPDGLRKLLLFIKDNYGNPTIIVTENGLAEVKNSSAPVGKSLKDELRIHCYHEHLKCLLKAIKEGADVRGYFIWSFIDNFEWCLGYNARFGITYVDYKGGLRRYLKDSAIWFSEFLQGRIDALFRPSTFGLPDDQSSTSLLHANK